MVVFTVIKSIFRTLLEALGGLSDAAKTNINRKLFVLFFSVKTVTGELKAIAEQQLKFW